MTPTADTLHTRATAILTALGDTPDQVADSLEKAGSLGEPESCGRCPIAVHLLRSDLGLYDVAVSGHNIVLYTGFQGEHRTYVDMPDVGTEFVDAFDSGRYTQLLTADER